MKTYTSQSIIMRTKEFGETDLLVTFFTPDNGRLKGIAKGARKSRKRFANCLDVLCLTELEYSLKREGGLYFSELRQTYQCPSWHTDRLRNPFQSKLHGGTYGNPLPLGRG